jgi:hypothetical protein
MLRNPFIKLSAPLMILSLLSVNGQLPGPSAGSFQAFSDIGLPGIEGKVNYQMPEQEYILEGSGENIWFGKDSFSFLWRRMNGDFILQAKIEFTGEGAHPHRKAGLMIRSGLSPDAPHVSCVIHGMADLLQHRQKRRRWEIRPADRGRCAADREKGIPLPVCCTFRRSIPDGSLRSGL